MGTICIWQSIVAAAVQRVHGACWQWSHSLSLTTTVLKVTQHRGRRPSTAAGALCVDQVSTGAGSASSRPQLGVEYTVCLHRHQLHVVVSFVQLGLSLRMKAAACHGCTVCVLCTHQLGRTWHLQQIMAAPSHAESVNLIAAVECICSSFGRAERISVPEGHGRRGLKFRRWRKA